MLTKEEFLREKIEKATKAAESEWKRRFETKSATEEGAAFARWVQQKCSKYAEQANKDMESRYRLYACRDKRSIHNALYAFLLHVIRRNCDIGSMLKSIRGKDIAVAQEIVEHILNMCSTEPWRKQS